MAEEKIAVVPKSVPQPDPKYKRFDDGDGKSVAALAPKPKNPNNPETHLKGGFMKKFLAWVVFVLSVVNLTGLALRYHEGKSTVLVDLVKNSNLENTIRFGNEMLVWSIIAFLFYLWYRWK